MSEDDLRGGQPPRRARRRLSTRKKLFFSSVCVLAVLLLGEGALRVRGLLRYGSTQTGFVDRLKVRDDQLSLWVLRPNYEQVGNRISIRTNSLGFRGEEISVPKPPGAVRIVCLGASTTFCAEASSNEKTWPHRLQTLLRERYPDVPIEVVNAGVPGYVAEESYRNLTRRVLPLDPDILIVYHAHNDIVKDTRQLAIDRGLVDAEARGRQGGAIGFLARYSLLVDLACKNLAVRSGGSSRKLRELPQDLPDRFIQELARIRNVAREHEIQLVLSTFATHYRRDQSPESQSASAGAAFYYMPWMTMETLLDAIDRYNAAIAEFADAEGIPVARDTDSIPADPVHFADHIHLTDAGCERMARRFADFLQEQGLIERAVAASGRP